MKKFSSIAQSVLIGSLILATGLWAADRVVGANSSLDMEPGARSAALGSATMAVNGDYLGLGSNPHQLADLEYSWGSLSHVAYYEDTQYDFASFVMPIGAGHGLGFALSRFGANDIPYIREGETLPEGSDYKTLSISDWTFSAAWGKRFFNRLDLGASFHLLYRDMDQSGFGFRGDIGARYRVVDQFFVSGLLKGWTSSATVWESGEFEYSSPELYFAASYSLPVSYLYGRLGMYLQSPGVFHREARDMGFDTDKNGDGRFWESPLDFLSGFHGGLELNFDFGLSLRVGLSSFTTFQSLTAGAGIMIADFLQVDYAFESHPIFSPVHRVSISVSPYLFGHPKKKKAPDTQVKAEKKVGPVESATDDSAETVEEAPVETASEAKAAVESAPVEATPAKAIVEDEEEVLETFPAGGTYWEE